jgi:hypothetical protein
MAMAVDWHYIACQRSSKVEDIEGTLGWREEALITSNEESNKVPFLHERGRGGLAGHALLLWTSVSVR